VRGKIENGEAAPDRGRLRRERLSPGWVRCKCWEIVCTIAYIPPELWPHSQTRWGRGAVPPRLTAQSCPAFLLQEPVICPLYARAIDIFGPHRRKFRTGTANCFLPSSLS